MAEILIVDPDNGDNIIDPDDGDMLLDPESTDDGPAVFMFPPQAIFLKY